MKEAQIKTIPPNVDTLFDRLIGEHGPSLPDLVLEERADAVRALTDAFNDYKTGRMTADEAFVYAITCAFTKYMHLKDNM